MAPTPTVPSEPEPVVAAPAPALLECPVNPEGTSALDCDGVAANGCEVDPFSDDKNCGSCGNVCGQGFSCIQKRCCDPETRECE